MPHLRAIALHSYLFGTLCIFFLASAPCQEVPKTMTRMSMRLIEPAPDPGSFAAQAKTLWRSGTKYARIAEASDLEHHMHGLTIINEPDIWMVNLIDKSGKHITDSGPSLDIHLPIFQTPSRAKSRLSELEFGRELEFFKRIDAKPSGGEAIGGKATDRYDVAVSEGKLVLWTDAASKKPVRISLSTSRGAQTFEYLSYEDALPFDPALFRPPAGVRVQSDR